MPFLLVWGLIFLLLEWQMVKLENGQYLVQSIGVWLDWPMHFSFMSWFSNQPWSQWFQHHPLAVSGHNNYPPLLDLIGSFLMRSGLDTILAIRVTGFFSAIFLTFMIYSWASVILKDGLKAGVVGSLFFLSFAAIEPGPVPQFVLGCFINSPAFMVGLAMICDSLIIFHRIWSGQSVSRSQTIRLWITPPLLVLVHIHSLICLFVIAAVYALYSIIQWRKARFWIIYGLISTALGLPILWWQTFEQLPGGVFHWSPWMVEQFFQIGVLEFWFKYTGLFLPVVLISVFKKKYLSNPLWMAGLVLFFLYNFVRFQTGPYDNIKLMVVMYLLFCVPVADCLGDLLRQRPIFKPAMAVVIGLSLTITGTISFARVLFAQGPYYLLSTQEDRQRAEKFVALSNPQDLVLAPLKHHHWALQWTGRPLVLGMRYFISMHGLDVPQLDSDVAEIYAGGPKAIELLGKYSIRYVITDSGNFYENESEKNVMKFIDQYFKPLVMNTEFFQERFPVVMDNGTEKVFRIPNEQK